MTATEVLIEVQKLPIEKRVAILEELVADRPEFFKAHALWLAACTDVTPVA